MTYELMASVYDHLMEDAPYDEWVAFTNAILERADAPMKRIVDLGCGTGIITTKLANAGYELIGVDVSPDMLSQAHHRAEHNNVNVQWLCQDLRHLEGIKEMDVAISYCDVMNYITTEEDLLTVFQNAADALRRDGLFIFDVHSLYHVEHHCINQTFADVTDTSAYIWFCMEGESRGEMYHDLTFFTKVSDTYKKFTELHHQRTFPIERYKYLLNQAGFEFCNLYGDFSLKEETVTEETERLFIIARKKAGN
ncbi:class I SAM-dependent DNA methyltransferase [Lentibacillus saliphilus]|uniref:class I SAM-dependent DNA methyltransferase n=1 Tax=Lentibacillus saliphilus TaxID=2737028 RepID=UPI001C2F3786|nr:class I SAM-dependent methyltransferase [Lentibacillus saliphilus]